MPADPRVGKTHHVDADEQLQTHQGEEALAGGWKGHRLTACGLWHDYAWVGVCARQNLMILILEEDERFEIVKPELRGRDKKTQR